IALRRIPEPIQSSLGALRRTKRAIAVFDAGYARIDPYLSPSSRAWASSPATHASTRSCGIPGWHVVEFDEIATAAASVPFARSGRRPTNSSIEPKKVTDVSKAPDRPGTGPRPAKVTRPSSAPPDASPTPLTAASRPS